MRRQIVKTSTDIQPYKIDLPNSNITRLIKSNPIYELFITHGYLRMDDEISVFDVGGSLKHGFQPKLLDIYRNVVDCSGEIEGREIKDDEIICCLGKWVDPDNDFGYPCIIMINPTTGLFETSIPKGKSGTTNVGEIDISKVCVVDYDKDSGVIPFTDLCDKIGSDREDPLNYEKLLELTSNEPRNDELIERWREYNRLLTSGEKIRLLPMVTLQLSDGPFVVYPPTFGYALNRATPLASVNMQRKDIELDLPGEIMSKVLRMITNISWPTVDEIEDNRDLIEYSEYIYNALDYLGFDFFPEFYRDLSEVV